MFENLFAQSGLSLERLKTFREIVAAGGITAAAGDDSNRQSQFSRQLKELERYFGVELLKRGHGPAELTDAGQRLYEIIGHTLRALEEFRSTCAGQPVELVVGAGESLIQWLLLPRLPGLAEAHPRLAVTFQNLKTDEILHRLLDGGVDFGVVSRYEPRKLSGLLASAPLGKLEFCLFAPATLLPANPRLKVKSDILGTLPLAMLEGSAGIRKAVEQEAQRNGIKLNVRLRFSSYPQLAQAVQSLSVAAIMPKLAAASFKETDVRTVPLPFLGALSRQVSLVWNRKTAEVRPAIDQYARLLPPMFRMEGR
jgi:DNA-binding transcriptional LysR family regulator